MTGQLGSVDASATFEFDLTPEDIAQAQLALARAQGKVAWLLPRWKRTIARVNDGVLQHTVTTLTRDGVLVTQVDARTQLQWSRFEAAFETAASFVLVSRGHASFITLPKRGINSEELGTVRDLLSGLPAPTRVRLKGLRGGLIFVGTTVGTIALLALVTGTWRL